MEAVHGVTKDVLVTYLVLGPVRREGGREGRRDSKYALSLLFSY